MRLYLHFNLGESHIFLNTNLSELLIQSKKVWNNKKQEQH